MMFNLRIYVSSEDDEFSGKRSKISPFDRISSMICHDHRWLSWNIIHDHPYLWISCHDHGMIFDMANHELWMNHGWVIDEYSWTVNLGYAVLSTKFPGSADMKIILCAIKSHGKNQFMLMPFVCCFLWENMDQLTRIILWQTLIFMFSFKKFQLKTFSFFHHFR